MRKNIYLLLLICLTACSSNNTYEQTIADHVQTDKKGTKYDMKFKALEIGEIARYTVADSIAIIKEAFEEDHAKRIAKLEESIENTNESIEKETNKRYPSGTLLNFYKNSIVKSQDMINALKAETSAELQKYENRKSDELLAIIVRCKYSIVPPIVNTTVEETFDFALSPDGTKCYGQKRVKG